MCQSPTRLKPFHPQVSKMNTSIFVWTGPLSPSGVLDKTESKLANYSKNRKVNDIYTPDIRSMWRYIVFAFPFVHSSVRSFIHLFIRSFVCSYVRSFIFPSQGQSFCVKVYKTSYFEDPLVDFIHILQDGRYRSKVFIGTIPTPWWPWGQGHKLRIFIKK